MNSSKLIPFLAPGKIRMRELGGRGGVVNLHQFPSYIVHIIE